MSAASGPPRGPREGFGRGPREEGGGFGRGPREEGGGFGRGPREEGGGGFGRGYRDRDDGGGYGRGYRDRDDEGRGDTVRDRLRARARKKARRQQRKRGFVRRKVCRFCADKNIEIDYRDAKTLRLFVSETGKMIPRRISGNCAKHQRPLAIAIKRARVLALVPYAGGHS
jgi:small subunit ribosomal protein S18